MTLVPTVLQTPSSPLYRRRRRESTTFNYAKAGRPGTPPIQTVLAPTTRPAPRERSNTCVRVRVDKSGTCSVEPSASRSFEQNDRTAGLRHLDDSRGDLRTGVDQRKVLGQGEDRRAKLRNEDDQKSSLNHDEDQQILNSKSRQILKNGQKDDIGDSQYYVASTDCSKNSNFEYSTPHNPANTKISSFDAKFKYVDSEDRTDSDDRADSEDCADYFNFSIDSDNGLKSAGNCVESTNIVPQDSTDTNFVPKGNTDTSSVKSNKNDSVLTTVPQSTTTVQNLPQDSEPTTDSAEELADIVVIPNHFQRSNTLSVQHDHFVPHAIAEVPEVVPNVRYRNSVANIHCNGYLKLLDNKLNHTINHQNSADTVLLQRPFTTVGHYSNQKVNSIGPRAKTLSTTGRSSTLTANSTTTGKLPYTNRQRSSIAISGNTVPKPGCTVPNLVAIARSTVSKSIDNSVPNLTEIAHRSVPRLTRESTVPTTVVRVPNYKYSNVLNPQISDSTNALANNIPQAYSNTSTQVLGGTLSYSNLNQYDRPFNTALQCTCNIELSTRSSFSALQSSNPGANLNPTRTVFGSRGSCSALPSCYTVGNNAEYTVPIQNIGTGDQARACLASTRLLNQNQTAIQGQNTVSSSGATVSTTLDGTVTPNSNTVPNFSVSPTPYAISPYSTVQLNQYSAVPITPNPTVPISPNTVLPISPYPTVATPSYSALTTPNPNKSLRLNDSTFSSRAPSSMSAFTRTIHPTATPPPCPVHSQSQRRFSMSAQQLGQARFRHKIGSYWRSFELYTDIPKTAELTRTGSIIRRRLAMLESFDAIKEEKSNGDVRFDVNDGDGNPHKRSAAQVKSIRRRQSGYGITITR
ncbi:unnamed protein product [Bursaphelenchus okinawaensis]|uniref:Uncharacterized protein n=1 Tax=Bursaphelenchus okinawaensis TaxID=465554 RepID=A0A811LFI7_9BILA|nr:unnamed protein product [Bursaphelenchus okinawaensis]CAG9122173.1 unnamed protein product [Bursaphelenchus okinawaensis]